MPGDLTPPVVTIKASRSFRLSKIGRRVKLKVKSNEAGTASVKLTLKPSAAARKRGKLKNRTVTIASRRIKIKAGTTTLNLKTTKKGKALIKKLRRLGRTVTTQKATITAVVTDAAGNRATKTATTKLSRR